MIELRAFGEQLVLRDGARVRLGTKKEYALLVYLGVNQGRVLWRDQLSALLWPRSTRARGRHSLSQAVYGLRRRLPELVFERGADELWLRWGSVTMDVLQFEAALLEGKLEAAAVLYRGGFMDGVWLKEAEAFEEWHERTRNRFEHSARHALDQLARQARDAGVWADAEQFSRRLLEIDPFNEEVHRVRLEAIAASGDVARALDEQRRVCALVTRELGRKPSQATIALEARFRQAQVALPPREDLSDEREPVIRFVGRAAEFARMREAWADAETGHGRAMLVLGQAGVGKTRLCYHFMRYAALQGARILESRCHASDRRLPYGAAVDALLRGLRPDDLRALPPAWAGVVTELLPELAGDGPDPSASKAPPVALDGEGGRRRLFEGIARLLRAMSEASPVLLFIDDFHWADESSAALLHYLARRCRKCPMLLVLALRSGEGANVARVWSGSDTGDQRLGFRQLRVEELDAAAAAELCEIYEQRENLRIQPSLRRALLKQVAGHPLFMLETLKAIKDGEIRPDQLARQRHPDLQAAVPLPASIEDFLQPRFSLLSAPAEQVLAALAVLGKRPDPTLAQEVSGLPTASVLPALEELTRKGMICESAAGLGFTHDVIREAVHQSLSGVRRRTLHERAARALQRRSTPCAKLATHFDLAGNATDAFRHALLASDASEKAHAYEEAEFFLRMAASNAEGEYRQRQAWDRLGLFLYRMRRHSEAQEFFGLLEGYYRTAAKTSRMLTVKINRAWISVKEAEPNGQELLRQLDDLRVTAEEAGDRGQLSAVLRQRVVVAEDAGEVEVMLSAARRLAELSRAGMHDATAIEALTTAARVFGTYTATEHGLRYANEAVERAEKARHPVALLAALLARATNAFEAGMLRESAECLGRATEIAGHHAIGEYRNALLNNHALLRLEQGKFADAEQFLSRSEELVQETGAPRDALSVLAIRAVLYREQGEFERAGKAANAMLSLSERIGAERHGTIAFGTLGLCALEQGCYGMARSYRDELLRRSGRRGYWAADCSCPEIFIARLWALDGQPTAALARLDRAIASYQKRGVLCRSRLELERARLLMESDPEAARRVAGAVRVRGAQMGAVPLVEKAERVLDRLLLQA